MDELEKYTLLIEMAEFDAMLEDKMRADAKKYFAVAEKRVKEQITYIRNDKDFGEALTKTRNKYHIPRLDPEEDNGHYEAPTPMSGFILGMNKKQRNDFVKDINKILADFDLRPILWDWVEFFILYGEPDKNWNPTYNPALLYDLEKNSSLVLGNGLTTGEKKYIEDMWRLRRKIKKNGRVPQKYLASYRKLKILLSTSKNKYRESTSLKTVLKITDGKKYAEVVTEIYPDFVSGKRDRRIATRLRKQKERNRKRRLEILGKQKLKK